MGKEKLLFRGDVFGKFEYSTNISIQGAFSQIRRRVLQRTGRFDIKKLQYQNPKTKNWVSVDVPST